VDQHAFVVEGNQAVSLIAVRQKRAGHRFTDDKTNHRMARQTRIGIGRSGTGQRLVNTKTFFTAAIGLAWDINHRHNRAFHGFIRISGDGFADHFRQRPAFQQAHLAFGGAREMVIRIRHNGNKAHRFTVQFTICYLYGRA
jgi:hypothetical protein